MVIEGQTTSRLRSVYRRSAPWYDLLDLPFEWGRYRTIRPQIFADVTGARRLLDCGVGTGRNIPFYPEGTKVTGIDLSRGMLAGARNRAAKLRRKIELFEGDVLALPFKEGTFCAATATFLFCVLPDEVQPAALSEIERVVKSGGRIVLLEYVLSKNPIRRRLMRMWAPWVRFAYGAAFDRRTEEQVQKAGLLIEKRRFVHADIILQLTVRVPDKR